jgi:hypothetical protein|tara:strand:+ start:41 stop:889 length:849 start_codon:yes stop_codon:yes gene_type:complete
MKREKFSIWGREPDTKKGCYEFMKKKKATWGIHYILNVEETQHMKNLMRNYYYTPLAAAQSFVQGRWKEVEDQIKLITIKYGPVFYEPRYEFYNTDTDPSCPFPKRDSITGKEIEEERIMWDFSVARCICFGGNGLVHESLKPKAAVRDALRNAIAPDRLKWKRDQGYSASTSEKMDAHHVDGKEFKTIYLKFLDAIKKKEDEFVLSIYPEHGNFESAKIEYNKMIGWEFKENEHTIKNAWVMFHNRNREYKLINPLEHHKITSDEIKFNTSIKKEVQELIK